ncbi:hypothetical protein [Pseudoroseomonas vastitatis]|nr:hypothetical protein [Pseudoroseomonas vastitatis]
MTEIWQIYELIFVLQTGSAVFTPTFQAAIPDMDLLRFSGEALDQLVAIFSNWAGLVKSSAE